MVANQAVVGVGSDGRIRLKVSQTTDALVDIVGWYPAFGNLSTTTPNAHPRHEIRAGSADGPPRPGGRIDLAVTGTSVVPPSGVDSVLLNVTAARPSKDGNLAVWPAASAAPNSSSLNFSTGRSISASSSPRSAATAREHPDVCCHRRRRGCRGWYPPAADYRGLAPARLLDTRPAPGSRQRPVDAASVVRLKVAGRGGVPSARGPAVVLTVLVTGGAERLLTAYPSGTVRPTTSNVNYVAGQTIANTASSLRAATATWTSTAIQETQVVADVQGYLASSSGRQRRAAGRGVAAPPQATGSVTKSMSSSTLASRVGSRSA